MRHLQTVALSEDPSHLITSSPPSPHCLFAFANSSFSSHNQEENGFFLFQNGTQAGLMKTNLIISAPILPSANCISSSPSQTMPNSVHVRSSPPRDADDATSDKHLRRSSRRAASSIVVKAPEAPIDASSTSSQNEPRSRRNPKRKAAEAATEALNLPDNLLDEALRPLTAADVEEWEGWVELESEPVSS